MDGRVCGKSWGTAKNVIKVYSIKFSIRIFKKIKSEKNDSKRERLQARDFWKKGRLQ